MTSEDIFEHHFDLYKLAKKQWEALVKEGKENSLLAKRWAEEMDSRLTPEQRSEVIDESLDRIDKVFDEVYEILKTYD